LRNSSADLQVKNPPPYSYQSLHNPDKKLYDKNRQEKLAEIKRELSKPPFLRNKYKTKREFESAINLLNNRPFKQEIIKIPEQNLNGALLLSILA
jgi:hypothetical protein